MNKEKIAYIRDICLLAAFGLVLGFLLLKFMLPAVLPFIIAWGVAFLTRSPADFLAKRTGASKKFFRPVLSVMLMLAILGGGIFIIVRLATEAWDLLAGLGKDGTLEKIISYILSPFDDLSAKFGIAPELEEKLGEAIMGIFSGALTSITSVVSSIVGAVPGIILFILVTAISVVYFSIDLENVNKRVHNILPKPIDRALVRFKESSLTVMVKYIRSYALIMLLTFAMMLFGLSVLGVRYALLMAVLIAVLDILPVLGIGIVLIPWGVFMLTVGGNIKLGIGLLVLWIIGTVVRQIAEPKIVGRELGIHPLLTLVLMYVGYSLFGFLGLVFLPLLSVFISMIPPRSKSESDSGSSDTA